MDLETAEEEKNDILTLVIPSLKFIFVVIALTSICLKMMEIAVDAFTELMSHSK